MTPTLWLCAFTAVAALAQEAPAPGSLAALEADARQKTAVWQKLAQQMESSVARLLPCDAKAAATITAASRASEVRLAASAAYLQAAEQQASRETAGARRVRTDSRNARNSARRGSSRSVGSVAKSNFGCGPGSTTRTRSAS